MKEELKQPAMVIVRELTRLVYTLILTGHRTKLRTTLAYDTLVQALTTSGVPTCKLTLGTIYFHVLNYTNCQKGSRFNHRHYFFQGGIHHETFNKSPLGYTYHDRLSTTHNSCNSAIHIMYQHTILC